MESLDPYIPVLKIRLHFLSLKRLSIKFDYPEINFASKASFGLVPVMASYTKNYHLDTGCKLNVHEIFRGRSGHLLNFVCTSNLRPVSRGN